jgi:hypothetical protein
LKRADSYVLSAVSGRPLSRKIPGGLFSFLDPHRPMDNERMDSIHNFVGFVHLRVHSAFSLHAA